jgi:hypothetical protein
MKYVLAVVLMMLGVELSAQNYHAWVYFTDKPNVTQALANPVNILTQKSLDRKSRHGVTIDQRDVPMNQVYVNQVKNEPGIDYKAQSKWFNCVHVVGTLADIDALAAFNFVDYIDYADPTRAVVSSQPFQNQINEPLSTTSIDYGTATNQVEMINLDALHDLGFTGSGITIAVTDSGFPNVDVNTGFAVLRNNGGLLGGYDFVAKNDIIYDDNFHGSRVLSVMAGSNSPNYEGTSPGASYYLFRTEEAAQETPAELSYWVAAAERADSLGVEIINVSLGYLTFDNPSENLTYSDLDGATTFISRGATVAHDKGMAVIVSVGNAGNSASHPYIAAPADALGTFSIGAVNSAGVRSSFSSIGPTADGRIAPDIVARGSSTASINESGNLVGSNGTSFSAPIISGAVACLMQALPNLPPALLYDKIREGSSQYSSPDNLLGYGIPDFGAIYQTLSLEHSPAVSSIKYYVNRGVLNFALSENVTSIHLYNLQGQQLIQEKNTQGITAVSVSHLSSGVYIFKVNGSAKSYKIAF